MISKELADQIKTKHDALELISDIAVDYDGCKTIESLKKLIDELSSIAKYGMSL